MRASHRVSIKYIYFVFFVVNLNKNICAHLHLLVYYRNNLGKKCMEWKASKQLVLNKQN